MIMNSSITHTMQTHSGLTLIELLVTLAVLSILIAIAAPNFSNVSDSNKLTTETNNLLGALSYARSEAVTRNLTVQVAVADATIAGTNISGGTTWQTGWKIYATNPAGTTLTLIRESQALPSSFIVTTSPPAVKTISFRSDGSPSAGMGFKLCDSNHAGGNTGRAISILPTGLTYIVNYYPYC